MNDAHVDTLGALLMTAGLLVAAARPATGRRRAASGALLGAATAVKLLPALALPGALSGVLARRPRARDLTLPGAAVAVFLLVYLPYVLGSGTAVLGYLPGYLHEEGYERGEVARFGLLRLVLPGAAAPFGAALLLLAVVLHVLRRGIRTGRGGARCWSPGRRCCWPRPATPGTRCWWWRWWGSTAAGSGWPSRRPARRSTCSAAPTSGRATRPPRRWC
ncbi:hypothetical protein GCM10025734_75380 [Kitasatospora paranensis]|uniref:hypothetical protein n=1 Tax=Kitasatospora paranensis TaxID=258053 RepID=UPI0031EA468D